MALKGDLASVDLAQVFQMLSLNQKVGILGIDASRATRALHFDSRGVTILFDDRAVQERVINQALRRGMIDDGALRDATAHSERTGQTVLGAFAAGGYLSDGDIASLMRAELEEEIYDIFFWRNASFEFYEGVESIPSCELDVRDERFYFTVDSVIMEAARRIDEWAFIHQRVRSASEVFRARAVDPTPLEDLDALIFDRADGMRNVGCIIDLTGLPRFQVFKSLAVLHEGGYVEEVPSEELWEAARCGVELGRDLDAIEVYEQAIESGADCSAIRTEAARVYERVEEFARASEHLKRVANAHVEAGELAEAVAHLQHVVQMLPTDLEAREQLVELTVELPANERSGFDPSADGKQLVDLYMEIGEIDRVRALLEQLLRVSPHDLALKKRLINVHTRAGDTRRVVELYESIANDLVRERQPIEAVKYLQKIVMIDRSRRDISDRIRGLYEADERRRSRRRSLLALGGLLLLCSGLSAGWYFYERYARSEMVVLEQEVHRLAGEEQFDVAIERLEAFIANYPLTIVSQDVQNEKARIVSLRDAAMARKRVQREQAEVERRQIQSEYRQAWSSYEAKIQSGDLDGALASIKTVQRLVKKAGSPEDEEWARSVSLDRSRSELESFISDAANLDREAWRKFDAGEWRAARADWLRLLDEFDVSATAKTVRLPVELGSRPSGALVFREGESEPLQRTVNGVEVDVHTPFVVLCPIGQPSRFEYRMSGFAPLMVIVDPVTTESIGPTLQVVPTAELQFSDLVRTPVGSSGGRITVGLRGGKFAIADAATGGVESEASLAELDDVSGSAVFAIGQCFFLTTDNRVECRAIPGGVLNWRQRLGEDPVHEPVLSSGRLLVAGRYGRVEVFDTQNGRRLWTAQLDGVPTGKPVILDQVAYFGTLEGQIVGVGLSAREVSYRSRNVGIATELHSVDTGGFVFCDDRGGVQFRRDPESSHNTWRFAFPRSVGNGEFVVDDDSVFVRSCADCIARIAISEGTQLGEAKLSGAIVHGPIVGRNHVYAVVRSGLVRGRSAANRIVALDRDTLELVWEYDDAGSVTVPPSTDSESLYIVNSEGKVLVFR